MPSFTLSPCYFNVALNDKSHLFNVLLKFMQRPELKLAIDKNGVLLNYYKDLKTSANLEEINFFFKHIGVDIFEVYEINGEYDLPNLLIKITCQTLNHEKVISVESKELFREKIEDIRKKRIVLEDKDEFFARINKLTGSINISTEGDHSPVIIGDRNRIR